MKHQPDQLDFEERALLRSAYYHRNLIKLVGVWDTVGSIGIPFGNFKNLSRRALKVRCRASSSDADLDCLPKDSYSEFLRGCWKYLALGRRYTRWVNSDPVPRRRKGLDLQAIIAAPDRRPEIFAPITRAGIERTPLPTRQPDG